MPTCALIIKGKNKPNSPLRSVRIIVCVFISYSVLLHEMGLLVSSSFLLFFSVFIKEEILNKVIFNVVNIKNVFI